MSASIGKAGGTVNIGKNGIRPTVGIPGSGMSFTPTQSNTSQKKTSNNALTNGIIFIISIILICIISACCIGILFFSSEETLSTPTPAAQIDPAIIIANTSSAAQTQTSIAMPPTILFTATLAPLIEVPPTATVFIYTPQTVVAQTSQYTYSTNTPFTLATQTLSSTTGEACSCTIDLDCKEFATHMQAQACFDYCFALGYGDIHDIDGNDKDGLACESLP